MKHSLKLRIHYLNQLLNKPIVVIIILVLLFAYFAIGNAHFEKENRELLTNTNTAVAQLNQLLCKGIPQNKCDLAEAVSELEANSAANTEKLARQGREIECLVAFVGANTPIDPSVRAQCQKMAGNVGLDDVSRSSSSTTTTAKSSTTTTTPAPVVKKSTKPQTTLQVTSPFKNLCILVPPTAKIC